MVNESQYAMLYNVTIKNKALKQAVKIPMNNRVRIFEGIKNLKDSETWGDVKRLVNHIYDYRLRVGNYRVLFNLTEKSLDIEIGDISVEEIKKRDERTY